MRGSLWCGGSLLVLLLASSGLAAAQSPGKKDPFLEGPPIPLSEFLDLLPVESEGRLLKVIAARGIEFPLTPANKQKLLQAGASPKVMDAIQRQAPAPPPAPPPLEKPNGTLTVHCEPAECAVSVQNGPALSTIRGLAAFPGLKTGEVVVEFQKRGYIGQQLSAVIRPNAETSLSARLQPNQDTLAAFGKRLSEAMRKAAGGAALQTDLASFSATGSATFFDSSGASSEWTLSAAFHPGQVTFEAKSSAGTFKLDCRGETCRPNSGGRLIRRGLKPELAEVVETGLRKFHEWQFAALADRWFSGKMKPTARSANIPASGEQTLRLEDSTEAYNVTLDAQFLPTLVVLESKSGLDSGLRVTFSDYTKVGDSQYPKTTEIKLANSKQGVRIRLDLPPGR
ncbi:MAG TPA: hypothetical protein VKV17_08695 [Bryobacteraceae bacterium]|nr:hypothetical protein [Bryobacteraceae bacterium]